MWMSGLSSGIGVGTPRQAGERELKPLLGAGPAHTASKTHLPSAQT